MAEARRGIAIVTAMGIESLGLSRALEAGPWNRRLRRGWHEGLLGKCPALLATCGVGQRSAWRWANVLLDEYEPRLVILTGTSGGVAPHVAVGDLVLGGDVYQLAGRQVVARYGADPQLLELARQAAAAAQLRALGRHEPRVVTGGVATAQCAFGNRAWGEALAREHGIVAVEMESVAVARACAERDVPFLAVRAVSDVIGRRWQWPAMVWNLVRVQRNAERLIYALAQFLDDEA